MRFGYALVGLLALAAAAMLSGYEAGADADFALGRSLPSGAHWLGTDHAGRDTAARLVAGAGAALAAGALGAVLAAVLGSGLGAALAWSARSMRSVAAGLAGLVGIPGALPAFVVLLLAGVAFGFDARAIGLVAGVLAAGELASSLGRRLGPLAGSEMVEARLAEGFSSVRVLGWHLLWLNGRDLIVRTALAVFPRVILVEAALACLPPGGFGVKEPHPSWGNMLARSLQDLVVAAPRGPELALVLQAAVPLVAILATVGAFERVAEGWVARMEADRAAR